MLLKFGVLVNERLIKNIFWNNILKVYIQCNQNVFQWGGGTHKLYNQVMVFYMALERSELSGHEKMW